MEKRRMSPPTRVVRASPGLAQTAPVWTSAVTAMDLIFHIWKERPSNPMRS